MCLMETIDQLLNQVEVLPASPSVLTKLLPILSDVDAHFDEVVDIVSLDPALTAELLRICNSAFFGQTEPIENVTDAVARVGYQSVYLLVAMINGANAFPVPAPKGIDIGRLWTHSVTTAFSAKYIAESTHQDSNLLFTAGLLHDVGKIIIAQVKPGELNGELYGPSEEPALIHEKQICGFDHAEVGMALMKRWGLPEKLVTAISHHHHPTGEHGLEPLAACVELGDLFSHGQTDRRVLASPQFMSRLSALDLGSQSLQSWFKKLHHNQPFIDGMSQLSNISRSAN